MRVNSQSPNQREGLSAISSATGDNEYVYSTSHALDVNVVAGGGSGTQYAEGTTTAPGTGTLALARYQVTPPSLTDGQMWAPQLDSAGNLKVTGSISVGGTTDNSAFTAGTSTGTPAMGFYHSTIDTVTDGRAAAVGITSKRAMLVNLQTAAGVETGVAAAPLQVSLANTGANATAVKVDGTGGAFPVTQSTNPWIVAGGGTAGSAASGVITVQGIASMTPVQVSQATASNLNATVVQGTATNLKTQAENYQGGSAVSSSNPLEVNIRSATSGINVSSNLAQVNGSTVATSATGVQKVGIVGNAGATLDSTVGAGTAPTNQIVTGAIYNSTEISPTNGQAFAIQADSKGRQRMVMMDAAGNTRGANVNASNELSVTVGSVTATNISTNIAQMNGVTVTMGNGASGTGVQRVTLASDSTGQVAPAANATSTGTAIYNNTALSSTKQAANASAGNLYGYHIYNPNSVVIYVQLFNLASASVTVGTTAPTAVIAVPAGGWADATPGVPIAFGTALTIAATTTSTGSGSPSTALLCNIWYK